MQTFDLQINGYAGIDFNSDCSTEDVATACKFLWDDGVTGILATIITDDIESMVAKIQTIVTARQENDLVRSTVYGLHLEGPFISPHAGYVGAHEKQHVRPANVDDMSRLVEAGAGTVKLVTLAPEVDANMRTTRWLADQNIVVSAGHSNASIEQLKHAIDKGLSMFTHVGNGCPMQQHRHDNIVQRALSLSDQLWCCFIADGVHIDLFALKNYLKSAGIDRSIVVTDAISAARLGPGQYKLGQWDIDVGEDLVARAPGGDHFVGSTVTMPRTVSNLQKIGLDAGEIEALTFHNPRKALQIESLKDGEG